MSVYDFSIFKNSAFSETIIYTHAAVTKSISAVVFRRPAKSFSGTKSDIPINIHPIIVEIDAEDIAEVTVNEDTIVCNDVNGEEKTFRVRAIITNDPGCWKLGL